MIDEALDTTTHDMGYSEYDCSTVSELDQVRQNIKIRLLMIKGEWFLDSRRGLPIFEKILVKNPNLSEIDVIIKATILETQEVQEILSYMSTMNRESRHLSVSFSALSDYGTITFDNLEL